MFTHMSPTQCNHQHCPHTFSIYMVNNHLHLCIHPCSDNVKRQWQHCRYSLLIQIVYPEDVFHIWKQPVIWGGEILSVGGMCRNLPAPGLHQIVHIMMAIRYCIVLEQNDTMLKQFWLFMANSRPPSPYSARVRSNTSHWPSYQLAQDGQTQVHFSWRT